MKMLRDWKINQSIAGCIIAFGGFGYGSSLAWSATALPNYDETGQLGQLTFGEKSWIGSLLAIGALVGGAVAGHFVATRGRKVCLWGFSALGLGGWVFLGCAEETAYVYCGRLLSGFSVGAYTILIPVFLSEIACKESRGLLGSYFVVMICLGKLFSNVIGIFFTANFASTLCAFHPLLFGVLLIFIPDSPKMLLKQNRMEEADDTTAWLQSTGFTSPFRSFKRTKSKTPQEMGSIEVHALPIVSANHDTKNGATFKECLSSPELFKPVLICLLLILFGQLSGFNVTQFYTVEILQTSGDILIDSKWATVILQIVQTVGCLPCSLCVDKFGRRALLLSSFLLMGLSMGGFAVFDYVNNAHDWVISSYPLFSLAPLALLMIYNLAYSWGIASTTFIVLSEMLPQKIMGPAFATANAMFWATTFVLTQTFQMFSSDIPVYIWFLLYSTSCIVGFLFNLFFLPETKGLTFEEIEERWKTK